jgi:flagellar motor switch protein FliN/FliY
MSESPASSVAEEKAAAAAAARPAVFPALVASAPAGTPTPVDWCLDIRLLLSVRIGSTPMLIRDLLQLGQGSVIELDKLAGEPMEVLVNGKLVARGEAVVVNEKLGVRLTDVISPMERVRHLQ